MLKQPSPNLHHQQGIVLVIALIMLIAMTLGGLALMRSVHTSTAIASNLTFQQSATNSADGGIEAAITWLENNSLGTVLHENAPANGYTATKTLVDDPTNAKDWPDIWNTVFLPRGVVTTPVDSVGNTAQYAIQRLCNNNGSPNGAGCAVSPIAETNNPGNGKGGGIAPITVATQVYYRITVRVTGARNAVSFVQTTVAI